MGSFFTRNAIFILFPAVIVAIVFLARINFRAAQSFSKWGEQSIVESTFLLAKEKVVRVESRISSTDHSFFQIVDPANLILACERWHAGIQISRLIEGAVIVDEDGQIVEFFHRKSDPHSASDTYNLIYEEIIPVIEPYDSLYQHKHLHRMINGTYRLVTTYTTEFEDNLYTSLILYDTEEIIGPLFENLLEDVGDDRIINVTDLSGNIIFGENIRGAGEFIVVQRFPSTLYKWQIQLAPRSAAFYAHKAQTAVVSEWIFIPLSFGIIVFGIVVLYMVWVRERRLNRLKSEFIANASHELKTPLALIRMFSELLTMKQVQSPEKIANYHAIILRETDRLTALIDNVLDFAKLERGKHVYEFREVNVAETVASAIEIYRHRVTEIGAKLVYHCEENLPIVQADTDAITLVLLNLIDNAIKYAKGTDIIGVELYTRSNRLFLDVYDRGQGIPAHHIKRVFERFYRYQAQDLETHGQRGSGIGLSLVKHIAKAHGGYVTVTSSPGVETRFSVRFPY